MVITLILIQIAELAGGFGLYKAHTLNKRRELLLNPPNVPTTSFIDSIVERKFIGTPSQLQRRISRGIVWFTRRAVNTRLYEMMVLAQVNRTTARLTRNLSDERVRFVIP